jgi:hypothetical protein
VLAPGAGFEPAISTLTVWRCASSTTPEHFIIYGGIFATADRFKISIGGILVVRN